MSNEVFRHGVASGDPLPDAVTLWTRVTTSGAGDVPVRWRVATQPTLENARREGVTEASAARDRTVHVDVGGLEPATTYYFDFAARGATSPVGRTRTAPAGRTGHVRLGLVACASWPAGFFNAYRHLAARELDLVVHLGDYLYEHGGHTGEAVRAHDPAAAPHDLAGYRQRHGQYKTDRDLQRLHARHPMVAVWDDHEIAGNAWRDGAGAHDPATHGDWRRRRDAAVGAYLEWVPVRARPGADVPRIYRSLQLGDLAELIMLDTRLVGRDRPAETRPTPGLEGRDRSLLGDEQREWLRTQLTSSTARWRLVGSQVMLAPLHALRLPPPLQRVGRRLGAVADGVFVNPGQWDGYPAERHALLEFVRREEIANVVVLSGDVHSSWAAELLPEGGGRPVGVEFVTPSITSASFADTVFPSLPGAAPLLTRLVRSQNPHVRYAETTGHGYVVVDITPERVRADWWHVDSVTRRPAGERWIAGWELRDGDPSLRPAARPGRSPHARDARTRGRRWTKPSV